MQPHSIIHPVFPLKSQTLSTKITKIYRSRHNRLRVTLGHVSHYADKKLEHGDRYINSTPVIAATHII
jgi:hypothetical protein